jgi:RNA polymerase sigma-70 factor (ECF subfamily)
LVDRETIENCMKGNLQEFRKLIDKSTPFAFSVAFRMLGEEAIALDIVQESMITIWKSINKIKSSESYKTWMYRIVVNKCYDELRRKRRNPEFVPDEQVWKRISETLSHNPETQLENREIAQIIGRLTDRLSRKQKAVFILSDLEEMTNNEISEITGMSLTKVKANLYYARQRIRDMAEKFL